METVGNETKLETFSIASITVKVVKPVDLKQAVSQKRMLHEELESRIKVMRKELLKEGVEETTSYFSLVDGHFGCYLDTSVVVYEHGGANNYEGW